MRRMWKETIQCFRPIGASPSIASALAAATGAVSGKSQIEMVEVVEKEGARKQKGSRVVEAEAGKIPLRWDAAGQACSSPFRRL